MYSTQHKQNNGIIIKTFDGKSFLVSVTQIQHI